MLWLHTKYLHLLSPRLDRFKKSGAVWNCRCPVCGDSETNKSKARGYFLTQGQRLIFYCHNCQAKIGLPNLLKQFYPDLYDQYQLERFQEEKQIRHTELVEKSVFVKTDILKSFGKISQLALNHPARKYIVNRRVLPNYHSAIYWVPHFEEWINTILPEKFEKPYKTSRLVFPLMDINNNLIGVQGRAINPEEKVRYITIAFDRTQPHAFNLNNVNLNRTFYVVEGVFDSIFVNNCIAVLGSGLSDKIKGIPHEKSNAVLIYDNEPRNPYIVSAIRRSIGHGYKVVIWPDTWKYKDINECIIDLVPSNGEYVDAARVTEETKRILSILEDHTYQGLAAENALTHWSRS